MCLVLVLRSGVRLYFYLSMFLSLSLLCGSKNLRVGVNLGALKNWYFLWRLVLNLLGGFPLFLLVGVN